MAIGVQTKTEFLNRVTVSKKRKTSLGNRHGSGRPKAKRWLQLTTANLETVDTFVRAVERVTV